MIRARSIAVAVICVLVSAGVANASWYDDYDAGVKAARAGNWQVVVDRMTKAINGNAKEDNKARTYGAIFINYHPYYYRGVANLNLGRLDQAISDLEKTTGPGPLDLGPIEQLIQRAKSQNEPSTPDPVPTTTRAPVPVPSPPTPTGPVIDAALRSQAQSAVGRARGSINAAQGRGATGTALDNAMQQLTQANTRLTSAKSNDDLQAAIGLAENAEMYANSARAPQIATTTTTPSVPTTTRGPQPPPTTPIIADVEDRIREALQAYYAGEFDDATAEFQRLTRLLPNNGWIWAFLGASQYSQYAFDDNKEFERAAMNSFRKARSLGFGKNGLPDRYFSTRIRRVFEKSAS
jgi:tetratricopeptide (TPR) repeat protein